MNKTMKQGCPGTGKTKVIEKHCEQNGIPIKRIDMPHPRQGSTVCLMVGEFKISVDYSLPSQMICDMCFCDEVGRNLITNEPHEQHIYRDEDHMMMHICDAHLEELWVLLSKHMLNLK